MKYLYRIERFDGKSEEKGTLFIMEADLDKRIASDISKAVQGMTNKKRFTKQIRENYAKALKGIDGKLSQYDELVLKEEYALQKSYENYSLGKMDRDTYLLERHCSRAYFYS